jgi:hypothetical protein
VTLDWNGTTHQGAASCPATYDVSDADPGLEVQATFSGDANFLTSTSSPADQTVATAGTTTSVSSTVDPTVSGQSTEFDATVSVTDPGSDADGAPTGAVEFQQSADGTNWSDMAGCGSVTLDWTANTHQGTASCLTSLAAADGSSGQVHVQAIYSGDSNFQTSTSSPADQSVGPADTSAALSSTLTSAVSGQPTEFDATISLVSPGTDVNGAPTGTVQFQESADNGTNWSTIAGCQARTLTWDGTLHQGTASCVTSQQSTIGAGYLVQAVYDGDANFAGATGPSASVDMAPDATSTVVSAGAAAAAPGTVITFTAKVTAVSPGAGTPTGTVTFTDGASVLCATVPVAAGAAQCAAQLPAQPAGQTVTATYSGDGSLLGSSGAVAQSVLHGYWLLGSDGSVRGYGQVASYGSMVGHHLGRAMVAMAATPDGKGYWLAGADGGVFAFGDAGFYGSAAGLHLAGPIVAIVATPDGKGYWLAAADGGVFTFGDARFHGSAVHDHLSGPIVSMIMTTDGRGYWLLGADGGVFAFGDARFFGSGAGLVRSTDPAVGLVLTADERGYRMVLADGRAVDFGDARGVTMGPSASDPVAVTATADRGGYWSVAAGGAVSAVGDATNDGSLHTPVRGATIVAIAGI